MTVYKETVHIPAVELEVLNGMMEHITPMTLENFNLIESACEVSWAYQKPSESNDYFDRYITAKFNNGMIMDVWFYACKGDTSGTYGGIQFGDDENIFMYCGEYSDMCYPIDEPDKRYTIDGTYCVSYNDDTYVMEIAA